MFKKFIFILAIILAVLSLLALFLPYFLNLNNYKPKIQSFVSEKMNAEVDFSSARINLLGGIGITLKDVVFTNTQAPFKDEKVFTAQNVDILFEFFPLFSKKLIGTVYLDAPTVYFTRNGATDNLTSLEKKSAKLPSSKVPNESNSQSTQSYQANKLTSQNADAPKKDSGFTIIINEFNIRRATVLYKDLTVKSSPTTIEIKNIDADIRADGDFFDIEKLTSEVFSGKLHCNAKIDTTDPQIAYTGKCKLNNFSLSDVYHSYSSKDKKSPVNGTADLNFDFSGRGTSKPVFVNSLLTKGTYKINEGSFSIDTAMPIILDQLGQFIAGVTLPLKLGITREDLYKAAEKNNLQVINLDNIKTNFLIKNGKFFIDNTIPMKQGNLALNMAIGLLNSSLKGTAIFVATQEFTKELIATNKNITYLLDKDGRFHLKVYLSGTVDQPKITVDTGSILQNVLLRTTKTILNPAELLEKTFKILPL